MATALYTRCHLAGGRPAGQPAQQLVPYQGEALGWFWSRAWLHKGFYIEVMLAVAVAVANVLTLAAVFYSMTVYDKVLPRQAYTSLWTLPLDTTLLRESKRKAP